MPKINDVWKITEDNVKSGKAKKYIRIVGQDDILVALNYYEPGYINPFHQHNGTSQTYLVMQGTLTLRTRAELDAPVEEFKLKEGQSAVIPIGEYYQLENQADGPLLLYQVKVPTDLLQIHGKPVVSSREHFGDSV